MLTFHGVPPTKHAIMDNSCVDQQYNAHEDTMRSIFISDLGVFITYKNSMIVILKEFS